MAAFTALAIGLSVAGMAASARAQRQQGQVQRQAGIDADKASQAEGFAAQRAAESQADLAEYNAAVADLQADDAIARGLEEENQFRVGVRGMIGRQRASIAAGNIDVGFGSAVDVQADAAFLGELDALTIKTNAAREAWGFKVQSEDLRRHAEIARQEGAYAAESGVTVGRAQREAGAASARATNWNIAGTLIGGGSSLLMQRYGFGRR